MALSSMTGFARGHGVSGAYSWAWELKSVNAKGFELRLRLPPGWDAVEGPARNGAAQVLARGTVNGTLTVERQGVAPSVRINEPVLAAVLATIKGLAGRVDAAAPRLDGILSLKGVIEVIDEDEREEDRRAAEAAVIAGFRATVAELAAMRRHEGQALGQVLTQRVREIAVLAKRAEAAPGRRPEAIKARIVEQVAMLLADGGSIGRRLDFLAQELNREANTLCSKSNDVELTNIGLELKSVVEQFREQVQNLE